MEITIQKNYSEYLNVRKSIITSPTTSNTDCSFTHSEYNDLFGKSLFQNIAPNAIFTSYLQKRLINPHIKDKIVK